MRKTPVNTQISAHPHRGSSAFTLLEVIIALALLTVGLAILVSAQANAVVATTKADTVRVATLLATEKMNEAQLLVERQGFTGQDVEEEGDFSSFGEEEFRGTESSQIDLGDQLDDYHWAYTIREIELSLPPDIMGTAGELAGNGYFGDQSESEGPSSGAQSSMPDISDFIQPDALTDMLSPYLREVRVRVWWGKNESGEDQVELLSHVINPTGAIMGASDTGTGN